MMMMVVVVVGCGFDLMAFLDVHLSDFGFW
jgi:hypothetical protein